jgi:hypothetical protein
MLDKPEGKLNRNRCKLGYNIKINIKETGFKGEDYINLGNGRIKTPVLVNTNKSLDASIFYQTTRRHIQENGNAHSYSGENLKSHVTINLPRDGRQTHFIEAKAFTALTLNNTVFWVVMQCNSESPTFRKNISTPFSESKGKRS